VRWAILTATNDSGKHLPSRPSPSPKTTLE